MYIYMPNFVWIGLFLSLYGGKKTHFHILPFFGLRHLVVSTVGGTLRQLNTSAQLQTFSYPTASKQFLYSNAFVAKSSAQTLASKLLYLFVLLFCDTCLVNKDVYKSVRNRQTNRQKNSTFLAAPAAGEIRAPPNLA